jgi:hypothetical protein
LDATVIPQPDINGSDEVAVLGRRKTDGKLVLFVKGRGNGHAASVDVFLAPGSGRRRAGRWRAIPDLRLRPAPDTPLDQLRALPYP